MWTLEPEPKSAAAGPVRVNADARWPLHDTAASRAAETLALEHAAAGTTPGPPSLPSAFAHPGAGAHALIERAGLAVARLAIALAPHAGRYVVFAGPGNNGGDGLVAARHLHQLGRAVRVVRVGTAAHPPPDAAYALAAALAAGVGVSPWEAKADQWPRAPAVVDRRWTSAAEGLVIDALLGLGSTRAPAGEFAAAIASVHAAGWPVLSVDLPSGLHPDTGAALGGAAIVARWTLALLTLKPGLFTGLGRDLAGEVWFDPLDVVDHRSSRSMSTTLAAAAREAGATRSDDRTPDAPVLPAAPPRPTAWLGGAPAPAERPHAAHKGRYGDVRVVGGAAGMVGAAWLAARAALAAGAGRVFVDLLDADAPRFDAARPELMSTPQRRRVAGTARHGDDVRAPARTALPSPEVLAGATLVVGCGGGGAVAAPLPALLAHAGRLVLDADGLNAVANDDAMRVLLRHRADRGLPTLLTPHPLECARLLNTTTPAVQHDRLAAARALAALTGACVLLKGSGSVVATPDGIPTINPTGNAALATAGTGDVLAGWAGGLWAQRPDATAAEVALAAAWVHGAAADRHVAANGPGPLRAAALIEAMAAVVLPG